MDHLPLPRNPTIGVLDTPYLCSEEYDGGPFLSYPQRRGWTIERPVKDLDTQITFKYEGVIVTNEHKLAGFLQTWLYFGILNEIFGDNIDPYDFQRRTQDGGVFLTSAKLVDTVKLVSDKFAGDNKPQDVDKIQSWATHLKTCMELAVNITAGLASSWQTYAILMNTGLSIAASCEYLQAAMNGLLAKRQQQLPELALTTRLSWRGGYGDCGQPLVERMLKLGWCPARIMYLNNQQTDLICLLWYFANLAPPSVHDNHALCTQKSCNSLQVDLREYRSAHVPNECKGDCEFRGPPKEQLGELVAHEILPLVTAWRNSDHSDMAVKLQPCLPDTEFVAISHVWADGMGNKDANTLPQCVLFKLQSMVNKAPRKDSSKQMPFWLDTLCLPVAPKDLRKKALEQMNEPYRKAGYVIVLDSYLQGTSLDGMDPLEMLARVIASGWHQRLWTFGEGRIGKNVHFLFKERVVSLPDVLQPWVSRKRSIPATPYDETLLGVAWTYTATALMPEPKAKLASFRGVPALRGALSTRTTSRPSDEALCLGIILNLDLKPIISATGENKMQEVWRQFQEVPVGLAFSHAPVKLTTAGYRWAPASFMGQSKGQEWGGPNKLFTRIEAKIQDDGLAFRLPGWVFSGSDDTADSLLTKCNYFHFCWLGGAQLGFHNYLLGPYDRWYACATYERWHQDPADIDYEQDRPALILEDEFVEKDVVPRYSATRDQELQYGRMVDGLLVSYRGRADTDKPVRVKVHRHVRIQPISAKEQQQFSILQVCVNEIYQQCAEQVQELRCMPISIENSPKWLINFMYEFFQKHRELIESGRETQAFKNYDTSDPMIMTVFTTVVHYMILVGDWFNVQATEQHVEWCID